MKKNLKYILNAYQNKYAIPHFNINNLEWAKYILETCEELKSPVILGVSSSAANYMGGYNVVRKLVDGLLVDLNIKVPVILHLDHGKSYEEAVKAIEAKFDSVMIDVSSKPIEENIMITNAVAKKAKGIIVESEIGEILSDENVDATNLETVLLFNKKAKVDTLAPAIGNYHGLKKIEPKIDFVLLESIFKSLKKPLVLHGGTGLSPEILKRCIENGVAKINFNTELQAAWAKAIKEYIALNSEAIDPRRIISSGEEAIKAVVRKKINILNSANKG